MFEKRLGFEKWRLVSRKLQSTEFNLKKMRFLEDVEVTVKKNGNLFLKDNSNTRFLQISLYVTSNHLSSHRSCTTIEVYFQLSVP